ncbi:MAG TPA: aminotransferase class V-fold PLP-dependent enzyme [Candidatus Solibacter sp.]|nr:aminotransferase class V-fold PLP-dependent enzyme [Candidatus Solibacter sp.]
MRLISNAAQIREMGRVALETVVSYYESLAAGRPVVRPTTSSYLRGIFDEPLPREGSAFEDVLATLSETAVEFSRHSAHPRFFGYVSSPGTPVNAMGSMVAAALNINVTGWRSAPVGAEIERLTIRWLGEMIGFPSGAGGLLVSGGSMANFTGIAAARTAKASGDVVRDGVGSTRMTLYVSEEGHFSLRKAAAMLGLGTASVRSVRTNARQEMDLDDLARQVREDRAAGHLPFCVVASAGTVASGAVDPIAAIARFAREENLWVHVDAAYGGFAALAGSARPLFAGIELADSVALDPHKWLYLPVGAGCVLYRDPETARAAFSANAEYTRVMGLAHDEAFVFWDYGPELSRPFRALDLWLLVKTVGARTLGEAIAENIACAKYFEELVRRSDDFEMLAPVTLSIFCFRYRPRGFTGDLDALNERVMLALQRGGSSYLSNARIDGKFALRGCVLNYRTTRRDMEVLLEDLRHAASSVA